MVERPQELVRRIDDLVAKSPLKGRDTYLKTRPGGLGVVSAGPAGSSRARRLPGIACGVYVKDRQDGEPSDCE